MPLTKKAVVLFDPEQYKQLEEEANKKHTSVEQIIHEAVELVILKKRVKKERIEAAKRLTSGEDEVINWEEIEKIITKGHVG